MKRAIYGNRKVTPYDCTYFSLYDIAMGEIERYIQTIDNLRLQEVMCGYFIDGLNWEMVEPKTIFRLIVRGGLLASIKILEEDGWYKVNVTGSHHQLKKAE